MILSPILFSYINFEEYLGETDYEIDEDGIETEIYDTIYSRLNDFNVSTVNRLDIDIYNVASNFNPKDMVESYLEMQEGDYDDFRERTTIESIVSNGGGYDPVDAIFER